MKQVKSPRLRKRGTPRSGCIFKSAEYVHVRAVAHTLEVHMDSALVRRDPEIMSGALCFSGTRVPVKSLFDHLEGSSTLEEFLEDFPTVSRERAVAVLEAAHESLAADAPAA